MLRNREEEETTNLRGVITAVHDEDIKLGQFTLLQNWIPSKVTAIKKKRGGVLFTSDEVEVEAPNFCASLCTDTSERGQQIITLETAFVQTTSFPGTPNLHTSWGHINNGELYSLIGLNTCGGGNMTYNNTCCQINHYIDDVSALEEAILLPLTTGSAFVNTLIGTSDRPVWMHNSTTGIRAYYELGTVQVDYATPNTNGGANTVYDFAVHGNEVWFYTPSTLDSGPGVVQFSVFNRTTGAQLEDWYSFGPTADIVVWNMTLTTDYLYCLGKNAADAVIKLYKISRADGTIVNSLTVTALLPLYIGVASDDLIYILGNSTGAANGLWYLKNFSTLVFVGLPNGPVNAAYAFGEGSGIWNNGNFYFGGMGYGGTTTDVFKIAIPCVSTIVTPLEIASVTADQGAVVAGNNLAFSWADILAPGANDTIVMKPAPAAGVLGAIGSTIATFTNSSALTDGSSTLAVPGGTTPGNYVLMYLSTSSGRWTATSNVFVVT